MITSRSADGLSTNREASSLYWQMASINATTILLHFCKLYYESTSTAITSLLRSCIWDRQLCAIREQDVIHLIQVNGSKVSSHNDWDFFSIFHDYLHLLTIID